VQLAPAIISRLRLKWSDRLKKVAVGVRLHGPGLLLEILLLNCAFGLAFLVRYGGRVPPSYGDRALLSVALVSVSYSLANLVFRAYRSVWRFASLRDMVSLALTVLTSVCAIGIVEITLLRRDRPIPISALIVGGLFGYLALSHLKFVPKLRQALSTGRVGRPVIIVGAGSAGTTLAHQLQNEPGPLRPVAFIDDDQRKVGRRIGGLPVAGTRLDLDAVLKRFHAEAVAIAIPSASPSTIRSLVQVATDAGARVHVVPSLHAAVATGHGLVLRDIGLEDLIQRPEVVVDAKAIYARFAGKRVLVTGAAGSIGSEIARQLIGLDPALVVLLDNNETGLTDLRDSLPANSAYAIRLADITNAASINAIFKETQPDIVIHAAAIKHVDVLEDHAREALRINVVGMWICARAAESVNSELFLLISSDKAVDAVNVLGATKALGEQIVLSLEKSKTIFAAVRFGNVLGSRGSVIPRFERQLASGGPLTVTHPDVRRYFMSVSESVRLVLQSAAMAQRGYIYVLDMGEEVAILSVAKRLAQLRGLRVPDDIEIVFTGLRPGERLTEHLVGAHEKAIPTSHPKVRAVTGKNSMAHEDWQLLLGELSNGTYRDDQVLRDRLLELARNGHQPAQVSG
jgi:FlaA1/EpsC-like NDP-sugar epimerase